MYAQEIVGEHISRLMAGISCYGSTDSCCFSTLPEVEGSLKIWLVRVLERLLEWQIRHLY